jgi:ribosomal protein S18 acetylase RimI-like enzyme
VRQATVEDLPALVHLLAHSFYDEKTRQQWFYPVLTWSMRADLQQRLRDTPPCQICLVVEDVGGLRATVELSMRPIIPWQPLAPETPRSSTHYLYLSNLAVVDQSRRQGIASHLIQVCEAISQDWGFTGLYLHVLKDNQTACNLYYRAGYRLIHEETLWEAWLLGRSPCLFLHKALYP